jgi:hypothetical protein
MHWYDKCRLPRQWALARIWYRYMSNSLAKVRINWSPWASSSVRLVERLLAAPGLKDLSVPKP